MELSLINQKNYNFWFDLAVWDYNLFFELKDIAGKDLDLAYDELDNFFCSFEQIGLYLESVRKAVNSHNYSLVTNYKKRRIK